MEGHVLKEKAKSALRGYWAQAIIVTVIVWLMTDAFTQQQTVETARSSFQLNFNLGDLLNLLLSGPLALGTVFFYMKIERREAPRIGIIFDGFKFFKKSFIYHLITTMLILLWTLLLIVPGIVAALRYSMGYYIMADNPEMSAMEALRESSDLMKGNKMAYFSLILSFVGWFIVSLITLGLGFLYLIPYFRMTSLNFYRSITEDYEDNFYVEQEIDY